MKRAALVLVFVLGFAAAGGLSATVVAETLPSTTATTGTVTGTTATTATTATTTAPTTTTTPKPRPVPKLPPRVKIGGVDVGGLTPATAAALVRETFATPLELVIGRSRLAPTPAQLGAVPQVQAAVSRALRAAPGTVVPLPVQIRRGVLERYLARLAKRFDRAPVSSELSLRDLRPYLTRDRAGRAVDVRGARAAITKALREGRRARLVLTLHRVAPAVERGDYGSIVVIRRDSKRLYLYDGMRFVRQFWVATGQKVYPTPIGTFRIVVKWRNPWWYPPESEWAKDLEPVPPGPGNPLGTRWMGISSPGVGIHGTPDAASIGYSASHGCVRMHIAEAEWLFERVTIGTPVFIVRA